jgi:voltage-dependent anion channel protein 2
LIANVSHQAIILIVRRLVCCFFALILAFAVAVTFQIFCRNNHGDTLTASYYHLVKLHSATAVGAELSHSFSRNESTLIFGSQHSLDPHTTVKARFNNYGMASALVQHEWRPKSLITISGEVDTKAIEKSTKVGLSLVLKP